MRNPPLVKMPKIGELLRAHPLLDTLPAQTRLPLESSTIENMKLRGATMYKEGSKPNGIWLISVGVVKIGFLFKMLMFIGLLKPLMC